MWEPDPQHLRDVPVFGAGSLVSSVRSHGRGPTSDKKRLLIRRDQNPERHRGTSPAAMGRRRPSASPEVRLRENRHCPRRMPDPSPGACRRGIDPQPVVRADGDTVDHLYGAKRTPRALGRPKKGQRKKKTLPFSLQRTLRRVSFQYSHTRVFARERSHCVHIMLFPVLFLTRMSSI